MFRDAKAADITGIIQLLQLGYMQTRYAMTDVGIDEGVARKLLLNCITRHGRTGEGACWTQVAVNPQGGTINGVLIGTLRRLYSISNALEATDLFWFGSEDSRGTDMLAMMAGMIMWTKRCPAVVEVNIAASGLVTKADPDHAGKILRHHFGMKPYGAIYQLSYLEKAVAA